MTTHDAPEAALAAALHPFVCSGKHLPSEEPRPPWCHKVAAAILAAMPDWTLVPDAERAAWATLSGDLDWAKAEIERLRAALEDGIEAFRLTHEYVGEDTLPAIEGWSWFDWCEKARAALAPSEPERIEE